MTVTVVKIWTIEADQLPVQVRNLRYGNRYLWTDRKKWTDIVEVDYEV